MASSPRVSASKPWRRRRSCMWAAMAAGRVSTYRSSDQARISVVTIAASTRAPTKALVLISYPSHSTVIAPGRSANQARPNAAATTMMTKVRMRIIGLGLRFRAGGAAERDQNGAFELGQRVVGGSSRTRIVEPASEDIARGRGHCFDLL